jgi:hypothetical protein
MSPAEALAGRHQPGYHPPVESLRVAAFERVKRSERVPARDAERARA